MTSTILGQHMQAMSVKFTVFAVTVIAAIFLVGTAFAETHEPHEEPSFPPYEPSTVAPQHSFHDGDPHERQPDMDQFVSEFRSFEKTLHALEQVYHDSADTRGDEIERLMGQVQHLNHVFEKLCRQVMKPEAQRLDRVTHELRQAVETAQTLAAAGAKQNHRVQHERVLNMKLDELHRAEQEWSRISYMRHQCDVFEIDLEHAIHRVQALDGDHKANLARDL